MGNEPSTPAAVARPHSSAGIGAIGVQPTSYDVKREQRRVVGRTSRRRSVESTSLTSNQFRGSRHREASDYLKRLESQQHNNNNNNSSSSSNKTRLPNLTTRRGTTGAGRSDRYGTAGRGVVDSRASSQREAAVGIGNKRSSISGSSTKLCCDKCDGPHSSEACPIFKK